MNVDFIPRLKTVIAHYGMTSTSFADRIGVPKSSISHLLSGRNKPSLDFVLKIVKTYPEVNLYWLLNGKGSFPSKAETQTTTPTPAKIQIQTNPIETSVSSGSQKEIDRIVIFYSDGTFESYTSGK